MKAKLFVPFTALAILALPAASQSTGNENYPTNKEIRVVVNGNAVTFPDSPPVLENGRVLIPLRAVLKGLPNMALVWDPVEQTVSGAYLDRTVRLRIGSRTAKVNGRTVNLDVPPMTIDGRTVVPLRFLSEALGAVVSWSDYDRRVAIALPTSTAPGAVASSTGPIVSARRFYRAPTQAVNVSAQQTQVSDEQLLRALEQRVSADYNRWAADRASWAQDNNNFALWASLQLTFNSLLVYNGSSSYNLQPQSAVLPANPGAWAAWQARLEMDAEREAADQQQISLDYTAYVEVFRRVNPNGTPLPFPPAP